MENEYRRKFNNDIAYLILTLQAVREKHGRQPQDCIEALQIIQKKLPGIIRGLMFLQNVSGSGQDRNPVS